MGCQIQVLFAPAELRSLRQPDLAVATCVVFDVLRATSTMVTALANGAAAIIPVEEIHEALAVRRRQPDILLAGERNGLRIRGALAGGIEFDLGNSPREFTPEKVKGRTIVSTTTNGTRALRACAGAEAVVIGSILNLSDTADFVIERQLRRLLLICAGTGEHTAVEDVLAAGAFCELLLAQLPACEMFDSAEIALRVFQQTRSNLLDVVRKSQNGRRLMAHAELRDDVAFCVTWDSHPVVAVMNPEGVVERLRPGEPVGVVRP